MTDLFEAYFRWLKLENPDDLWARDRIEEIFLSNVDEGWTLTLRLLAEAPSANALCYVAASQLEILIRECGAEVIDRVADEANHNRRMLYALCNIYVDSKNPVFTRYKKILERSGIESDDDLQSLIDYLD